MKGDKACFAAKAIDEIKFNSEEISALQNEIWLKYSSETAEGLMVNKVDKSYLTNDADNHQSKYWNVMNEILAFVPRFINKL